MTVDVLVPTVGRPASLAVVLTSLLAQRTPVRVVVADQTEGSPSYDDPVVASVLRVLRHRGAEVELHHRPERRGVAEQRHFLLSRARHDACLSLDDDVLVEPGALDRLVEALDALGCGFVGMAMTGLSHLDDRRPADHAAFEPWDGPVVPERVRKGTPAWERWRLHNAATPTHLGERVPPGRDWLAYRVAWVAGCVLFRTAALREAGGYDFWADLGATGAGEDVAAQLRVLERAGGAGLLPTGAVHLELETTLPVREVDGYAAVLER